MKRQNNTRQARKGGLSEAAAIFEKILAGCLLIMLVGIVAFGLLFVLMLAL